jgi:hypothetical protein
MPRQFRNSLIGFKTHRPHKKAGPEIPKLMVGCASDCQQVTGANSFPAVWNLSVKARIHVSKYFN